MEDKSKQEDSEFDNSSTDTNEEKPTEQESKIEEIEDDKSEETTKTKDEEKAEQISKETDEIVPTKEKKVDAKKPEGIKEKSKKKVDRGKDFKYIVRLSNTDIDGEKNIVYGLASIKGIGVHMASLIANEIGIDRKTKFGDLKDQQIEKIQEVIDKVGSNAPKWMLNHRKDLETGEDIHLIGVDIDMSLRDEINLLKKIRSYRGIRHERGLRVRGQRTRANNRRGLALGVSKKREISK